MKLLFVYINIEQQKKKRERETLTLDFDDYHNFDFHDSGEDQDALCSSMTTFQLTRRSSYRNLIDSVIPFVLLGCDRPTFQFLNHFQQN